MSGRGTGRLSFDPEAAARVRRLLSGRDDVVERTMVGGLSFLVNGNMCCGVTGTALMIRVGADGREHDERRDQDDTRRDADAGNERHDQAGQEPEHPEPENAKDRDDVPGHGSPLRHQSAWSLPGTPSTPGTRPGAVPACAACRINVGSAR